MTREAASCSKCGSNVRTRGLLRALAMELFGVEMALPDFPRVQSIRGIGTSDAGNYAAGLAEKFDYRNTFHHREPRLDIVDPPEEEFGKYDFLISSEVFEHVPAPAGRAFENACRLLKPHGVLILSVPYSIEKSTVEHFPELRESGLAQLGDRTVLVARKADGAIQVFEDLVFHVSWGGSALEMREFCECGLKETIAAAGFREARVYGEECREFGIINAEPWSLPVAARKEPFTLSAEARRDILEEWRDLKQKHDREMKRIGRSWWYRIGRRLGGV